MPNGRRKPKQRNSPRSVAERSEPPSDMNLLRERAEKLYKMETGKLDARESYYFNEVEQDGRHYKFSFGVLQKPSQVENFRDKLAQRDVSAGTGMHASHLTGDRFGAPGRRREPDSPGDPSHT